MGRVLAIQTGSTLVSPAVPNAKARRNQLLIPRFSSAAKIVLKFL